MRTFPQEMTERETSAGFVLGEVEVSPGGPSVTAVVADLPRGLRAVKTERADGFVEYAIYDQGSLVVYVSLQTLELLRRSLPEGPR